MDNAVELVSDADGLGIIGGRRDVERFLASRGLLSLSEDLELYRLGPLLHTGAGLAQAGAEVAAHSSRWLKLTEESAQLVKELGLMETKMEGVSYAMLGTPGNVTGWLKVAQGAGTFLTNPAVLSGVAGLLTQAGMRHEMGELKKYLATIDKKVDEVLRNQKNAELQRLIGAWIDIESALALRREIQRVDPTNWSTVQGRTQTISDATAGALLRLNDLAKEVEGARKIGETARVTARAGDEVAEMLAVLAHCFELQDALDVLRLDRVREESPADLDAYRLALRTDRQQRRERVSRELGHLMARLDAVADAADARVLLHASSARAVVDTVNRIGTAVENFRAPLGIEGGRDALTTTRWRDAARSADQLKNAAVEVGRHPAVRVGVAGLGVGVAAVVKNAKKPG
ncbi:hypothetical protein AAHZ94_16535 [Streptomyces sp. HSW2009]|uniref:hypothetical protein n=1 Tax=Streptomyces sp. HSW2009 TaxID=3142890 RepID=UPI0032EF6791